jgi:hypothetical protein
MRKHLTFAIATGVVAVAMIVWAKAAVVAPHADTLRPGLAFTPQVMSNSYLPIQVLDKTY